MSGVDRTPPKVHLRINGEKIEHGSGGTHEHISPATGQVDARIPLADKEEVDRAVTAAHEAFDSWKRTTPAQRRPLLNNLADLIEENAAAFGRLGSIAHGKQIGRTEGGERG